MVDGESARWSIWSGLQKHGLLDAIQRSLERNYRLTSLTFNVLGRIITGRTSVRTLSGPIEIARYSGRAASTGGIQLLSFMAFVSLQVGIPQSDAHSYSGWRGYRASGTRGDNNVVTSA